VFAAQTFELEREQEHLESEETIPLYSPERTVVDMMRLRHVVGRDQGLATLRRYVERPGARPGKVVDIARRLRAGGVVQDALETLLS
jgi:hypothetical protein